MDAVELLAIVEVEKERRVRCRSEGCKHTVYKKIHIVLFSDGTVTCYGQSCFKELAEQFPKLKGKRPSLGDRSSEPLTDEERLLLEQNTEELLNRFRRQLEEARQQKPSKPDFSSMSDAKLKEYARSETRRRFIEDKGINPDLAGWKAWFEGQVTELYQSIKLNISNR